MRFPSTLALVAAAAALSACSSSGSPSGPGASGGSGGSSASGGSSGSGGGTGGLGIRWRRGIACNRRRLGVGRDNIRLGGLRRLGFRWLGFRWQQRRNSRHTSSSSGGAGGSHATGGSSGSGGTTFRLGGSGGLASGGSSGGTAGASSSSGGASGSGGSSTDGADGGVALRGPCDIYAAASTPCVAAHSTVRALYGAYSGKLYQVRRSSDMTTHDIPVLSPGGLADSAQQDAFCTGMTCTVSIIYDQSPMGNHMPVSPPVHWLPNGGKEANATAARITIGGHTVYGILFPADSTDTYRNNATKGVATGDMPEAMYMVADGNRYNGRCCFDYGNVESTGNPDGPGTMETLNFSNISQLVDGRGQWSVGDDRPRKRRVGRRRGHGSKQHTSDCEIRDAHAQGAVG